MRAEAVRRRWAEDELNHSLDQLAEQIMDTRQARAEAAHLQAAMVDEAFPPDFHIVADNSAGCPPDATKTVSVACHDGWLIVDCTTAVGGAPVKGIAVVW